VSEAFCPVIALLDTYDGAWVNEAAARGVFAYIATTSACESSAKPPTGTKSSCRRRGSSRA